MKGGTGERVPSSSPQSPLTCISLNYLTRTQSILPKHRQLEIVFLALYVRQLAISHWLFCRQDGMICLAGCDKTIPGVTMALPRLNAVSWSWIYHLFCETNQWSNSKSSFQLIVVKPKPTWKYLFWPITTDSNNAMNQSEFKTNSCQWCQARENVCKKVLVGFDFAYHWLRVWRKFSNHSQSKGKQN